MGIQVSKAADWLAPYVKSYWGIESHLAPGQEHIQRIVPNGLMELMFYLGDLPESLDSHKSVPDYSLITGQQQAYYDLKVTGTLSLFSIIFQPHGLVVFFDIPLNEIFNQNVPLKDILKDEVSEVESKLAEAGGFYQRIRIVEDYLRSRIRRSRKKYEFERIRSSIQIINQTRGIVGVDFLASKACLGRKQFERTFQEFVGSSPKKFLKTVRFQSALNEKSSHSDLSLTELSYRCGYFDQSHMTGDFHTLAGMTPGKYFSFCEPYSDYFQSQ